MILKTQFAKDITPGSVVEFERELWKVLDVRRHVMTVEDHTVWLILEGYKKPGRDQPRVDLEDAFYVVTL